MKMVNASWRCLRCNNSGNKRNAMAVASQHSTRTGHPVEVTTVHRAGHLPAKRAEATLPLGGKHGQT